MTIRDRTAIAGIGATPFAKSLEGSEKLLACQAIVAALDDAGIEPRRRPTWVAALARLAESDFIEEVTP